MATGPTSELSESRRGDAQQLAAAVGDQPVLPEGGATSPRRRSLLLHGKVHSPLARHLVVGIDVGRLPVEAEAVPPGVELGGESEAPAYELRLGEGCVGGAGDVSDRGTRPGRGEARAD